MRRFILLTAAALFLAMPAAAERFDHDEHVQDYADGCQDCHKVDDLDIVPDDEACLACHDEDEVEEAERGGVATHGPLWAFNHRASAKVDAIDCAACHDQAFCTECHKAGFADEQGDFANNMDNIHRSEFLVTHPIAARTDQQLCTGCHENQFCVDCHEDFLPEDLAIESHRKGWSRLPLGPSGQVHEVYDDTQCEGCHPDSVLPSHVWSDNHAREARKNLASCQSCHPEGDICLTCHSAVTGLGINPHPKDWDDISGRLKRASGGKTCRKCH